MCASRDSASAVGDSDGDVGIDGGDAGSFVDADDAFGDDAGDAGVSDIDFGVNTP